MEEKPHPSPTAAVSNDRQSKTRTATRNVNSRILAQTDGFRITYHEQKTPSNKIVVTFDGIRSGLGAEGFGTNFILSRGYDNIFVAQKAKSQYQMLSIEEFFDAVKNVISSKHMFTYGSSLGGYCALYYGGCIDATIIAAGPRNSALPEMMKQEFAGILRHLPLSEVPKSSKSPVVLYDPHRKADKRMIKQVVLPAYPDARILELPFYGHNVLLPMQHTGALKPFILSIIDKGVVGEIEIKSEGQLGRPKHKQLLERLDYLINLGMLDEAQALLLGNPSVKQMEKAYNKVARALIDAGRTGEAAACVIRGLERYPNDAILLQLARNLEARNQPMYKRFLRRLIAH